MNDEILNKVTQTTIEMTSPTQQQSSAVLTSVYNNPPLAVSVPQFCELTSLGKTTATKYIREGRVETRRLGRRTVILMRSVYALLGMDQPQ